MRNKFKVLTIITIVVLGMYFFEFSDNNRNNVFDKTAPLNFGKDSNVYTIPSNNLSLISPSNSTASGSVKSKQTGVNVLNNISRNTSGEQCPDVLKYMTNGNWKVRDVTLDEEKKIELFLLKSRNQYGIPASLQRKDGKCGNTSFENPKLSWFRPLCDPKGPNPCCYNNVCVNKSIPDCMCRDCFDMRTSINAELADWIPSDKRCPIPTRTGKQLCQFVDGLTINFIGDSFIRHIYLAVILLLKDNVIDGAMKSSTPPGMHNECKGFYMFTEKRCRPLLEAYPVVCGSRVTLHYYQHQSSTKGYTLLNIISQSNNPKSYFIVGTGVHDNFNTTQIWNTSLLPVLRRWKALSLKPTRLLWHAAHAPGLLKTPTVPTQGYARAIEFNREMKVLLQQYNVPIFESFNFTDSVNSFDGAHFGQGVNLLKARIILEYFRELNKEKLHVLLT